MNPTEIADALEEIAQAPFDADEFPFAFAEATDNAPATVSKLRSGSYNKSKLPNGVLMNKKFYSLTVEQNSIDDGLKLLREDKKTKTHKPSILIVTDGIDLSAEHTETRDTLHCSFADFHKHFGFFLPAAGMSRYKAAEENEVDIKATGKLAKLYDALLKKNPDWSSEERRHDLNQFMTRLIFCMFAEDVGIFEKDIFSRLVFNHSGNKGAEAHLAIIEAFKAMNLPEGNRSELQAWTEEFPYVNGGLFSGPVDSPEFDKISWRYFQDSCQLDWQQINPDIFGSMIQSVADPEKRSELGMHYTSPSNILKVLEPLFLNSIDNDIEKHWENAAGLKRILDRLSRIRLFDPACGSGNFLVIGYREIRAREMRILKRIGDLEKTSQAQLWSNISLANFYGIEITDFGAETAKLSLFIAEYQENKRFSDMFGAITSALPLKDGGNIYCGNALHVSWSDVCPPPNDNNDLYIAGNPPFLGKKEQSALQKSDVKHVFHGRVDGYKALDFVSCWFMRASDYVREFGAEAGLVSTNSICQGSSVGTLWPSILVDGIEISFAHRSFKWRNSAANKAAVICVIVGLRKNSAKEKVIFDGDHSKVANNINAYLIDFKNIFINGKQSSIFGLPEMNSGNALLGGAPLILTPEEKYELVTKHPESQKFIKQILGSKELINGVEKYCIWVDDADLNEANNIKGLEEIFFKTRENRLSLNDEGIRKLASRPHQFRDHRIGVQRSILVPQSSSENRNYLPVDIFDNNVVASYTNFTIFDVPEWCVALISSRLHLVWIYTVCGKIKSDFRYSNTLGWNTFPVPNFTDEQYEQLNASARAILKTRYLHHPKTIAQLYDPKKMPDDLKMVHQENDRIIENMYVGRSFKNDTERLEHLFKVYAAKIKITEKQGNK